MFLKLWEFKETELYRLQVLVLFVHPKNVWVSYYLFIHEIFRLLVHFPCFIRPRGLKCRWCPSFKWSHWIEKSSWKSSSESSMKSASSILICGNLILQCEWFLSWKCIFIQKINRILLFFGHWCKDIIHSLTELKLFENLVLRAEITVKWKILHNKKNLTFYS